MLASKWPAQLDKDVDWWAFRPCRSGDSKAGHRCRSLQVPGFDRPLQLAQFGSL